MELEYTITPNLFKEYAYQLRYKWLLIVGSMFSLAYFILGIIIGDFLMIFLSVILILIVLSTPIICVKVHFRINNTYFKNYSKSKLILKDNIILEEVNNHLEYSYDIIKDIKETKNLIVLCLPFTGALLISKEGMSLKEVNNLISFIRNKIYNK